ncbi:FtsK/SpoIIIE domain-containing protein [Humibacter ginsengisoli]
MRLKLSVVVAGATERDVLVTADVTATVADVAARLAPSAEGPTTLRVEYPGRLQWRLLNPGALIHDSGLRSGCRVEVVPMGSRRGGDDVAAVSAALARVTSGPDAGAQFTLTAGANVVGRAEPAQVLLANDEVVSRRHAVITVGESITVSDVNSANGVHVDGRLVHRAVVTPGTNIQVGDTVLQVLPLASPGQLAVTDDAAGFVRSPRVEPAYRGEHVVFPEIAGEGERPRFPVLAVVAPIVLGFVLFFVTRQLYSLIFVALSPIIMFGTWVDGRLQAKRRRRDESKRFEEGIALAREQLTAAREEELAARTAESPSTAQTLSAIAERSPLLWTRKPEHTTFLEVRFGVGALPSRTTVQLPSKNGGPDEWRRVEQLAEEFETVEPVPVVENLERAGAVGVAGGGIWARDAARALMLQLAGLHSPADLVVAAMVAGEAIDQWEWLKWLPHVDSPYSPLRSAGLASDYQAAGTLLSELEGLVAARRAAGAGRGEQVRSRLDETEPLDVEHGKAVEQLPATPVVVVLVAEHAPADRSRLVALSEEGPDAGVFLVWLAASVKALPVSCRTYLDVDETTGCAQVGFVRSGRTVRVHKPELVDVLAASTAARSLAPLADTGARVLDETDLPHSVSFVDLYEGDVLGDAGAIVQRWVKNDSLTVGWIPGAPREPGGIRAVVGQGPSEPFALDLREHGPHALVGGTTGAGKSEFLQTWLMGIATEYSPDRATFLLVDYKGGAAFAECVGLPHTVGLVTDLTPHLVRRALTSLRAELRYRERLLNVKGAKDLQALERRSDPDAPPVLLIVIDEFAALATEVPEFVDGVIDVAQRGRSLGLHLVMATQRPSGVIKDSLRANTNLRVALRVADETDSVDVLGSPVAAFFDPGTPGRAAAKLGPGRVHDFQTAYLGGRTRRGPVDPDVQIQDLPFGPGDTWQASIRGATASGSRDIEQLAGMIARAADARRVAVPRKPWLDPLPAVIDLKSLQNSAPASLPVGVLDDPAAQEQRPFAIDWDAHGNVAVIGAGGAGKSALLRTIGFALSSGAEEDAVALYGLDFAGGGLRMLVSLPTVGAIIAATDRERVGRLFRQLADEVERRATSFAAANASTLTEYRAASGTLLPRIVVLFDGFGAFRTEHEFDGAGSLFDRFLGVASVGRQLGVHLVMTADRSGAFPTGLSATIGQRVVMRLASETEYAAAGVPADVLHGAPVGRALVNGHEVQFAVPSGTPDLAEHALAFETLAEQLRASRVAPAEPVRRLPSLIQATDLPSALDGAPVLGLSDESLAPVALPTDGLFVVTGPFGSGRTTAMRTAVQALLRARPQLAPYLLVARRSQLADTTNWVEASVDADSADELAGRLAALLESRASDPSELLLVVENAGDFAELPAEGTVARLLKAARRADALVLAEADTITAPAAWQLYTELKTARAGIVLQPEEGDGLTLFRTQFPRVTRAEFPPGRGILVDSGRITRVQVAYPAD